MTQASAARARVTGGRGGHFDDRVDCDHRVEPSQTLRDVVWQQAHRCCDAGHELAQRACSYAGPPAVQRVRSRGRQALRQDQGAAHGDVGQREASAHVRGALWRCQDGRRRHGDELPGARADLHVLQLLPSDHVVLGAEGGTAQGAARWRCLAARADQDQQNAARPGSRGRCGRDRRAR
eukprot:4904169-Prymnesium_polylepis.1